MNTFLIKVLRQPFESAVYRTSSYRAMMVMGKAGIHLSISGRKSACHNAMAERVFSNRKNELVQYCDFATCKEAKTAVFDYLKLFYNRRRIHQSLNYCCPVQFERMNYGA